MKTQDRILNLKVHNYVTTLIEYSFVKTYTWWKRNHQMSAVRVEIQLALASIVCYHGPQCISVIYWNLLEKWGHNYLSTSYSSTIYVTAENAGKNFDFSYTDLKWITALQYWEQIGRYKMTVKLHVFESCWLSQEHVQLVVLHAHYNRTNLSTCT